MSEQALDLKRFLQIVRRQKLIVLVVAVLGLSAGGAYAVLRPSALTSTALVHVVLLQSTESASGGSQSAQSGDSTNGASTLVVFATSDPVLTLALPSIRPPVSRQTLHNELVVKSLTSDILSISAQGRTAAQAEDTANAVARGFVEYVRSPQSLSGATGALVLNPASTATGRTQAASIAIFGVIGILLGAVLGVIGVLAVARRDRRLRQRDDVADSIGVPVLASIPVGHPSDAAGWVKLVTEYEPAAVDAWRLRGALDYLGVSSAGMGQGEGMSLALLSLRSDPGALAIGPQLAVFAASLGIRTNLVIGLQQEPEPTATLRAACTGMAAVESRWPRYLHVTVRDEDNVGDQPAAPLTVLVAVVDEQTPRMAERMRTTVAVLGVSAGAATAEDLARVAASAADRGRPIAGIIVADPDPADHTTGRLPQLARPTAQRGPTRLTGIPTETRQWMTKTSRA
jgi:capsular polysaccharide biosynthesis protein